ncbi:undecaprenyl-phosphate glucose phosphotransferase [Rhodoferax sp.]|uniref:undecaprenyl-phosphate glucose phosphotransferase n=1 Tax=Rhodoferax sp. TaxID=50421 RepID=UPI002604C89B|nr:undecaprenyl-phosphate glucose phosphotransferase [Rhodoferax sp.]MDD3936014.1 undecaprenyl-phosphate glucose phosphotransferase [Rhodoferax sp.]
MSAHRIRLSHPLMRPLAMAADTFIILACALGAYLWHDSTAQLASTPVAYLVVPLCASLMLLLLGKKIYQSWRFNEFRVMLGSVTVAWLGILMVIIVGLFLAKTSQQLSRLWFVSWAGSTLTLLLVQRLLLYAGLHWLRRKGYNYRTVVLIGNGESSHYARQALKQATWSGLRLLATIKPDELSAFINDAGQRAPDEIWLCIPLEEKQEILAVLDTLRHCTSNIRMVPDTLSLSLLNYGVSEIVGVPMLNLSVSPIAGGTQVIKAVQDYVLALLILVLISPLMLLIACAIKLSSKGPVFYQQLRHGWNGEEIWVYKFRSMVVHAEQHGQVTQAQRGDARVTPLGAFLRRTSLDELPQFINVLQGRMSIVGPRPHAISHNHYYKDLVPRYMLRHKVRPGITGWAQINGFRGETDTLDKMHDRVTYDLYYIEHISLWLDLKIIAATLFKGFVHHSAY